MKIKILILTAFSILLLWSCTPEVEEDMLSIYSENNSIYAKFDSDTIAALVKTRYSSIISRNGVTVDTATYSANTLTYKMFNSRDWFPLEKLDNDSAMYVTEYGSDKKVYIRYDDTLVFVKHLRDSDLDTTIVDTAGIYTDIADFTFILSADSAYIDSLNGNNSLSPYKTYRSWKDDMINLYR